MLRALMPHMETALGLFAAIPAVIAYNRFSHGLNNLEARLNRFADKFHATLSREVKHFHTAGYSFPYDNMYYVLEAGGNSFYEKRKAGTFTNDPFSMLAY